MDVEVIPPEDDVNLECGAEEVPPPSLVVEEVAKKKKKKKKKKPHQILLEMPV
jgi:hypothetical protein